MSSNIAVTGGSGFVGRHLLSALHGRGHGARLLVRDPSALAGTAGNWDIVKGDLRDRAAVHQLVAGTGTLIHIAGIVAAAHPAEFAEHNTQATADLAAAAAHAGVRRFVYISSLAARQPQLSPYAASKAEAENRIGRLDTAMTRIIVRPPAVYGPGDRATLPLFQQLTRRHAFIPALRTARFSLIHAEDLANRVLDLALTTAAAGTYECDDGTPGGYSWPQIAAIAGGVTGHQVDIHFLPRPLVSLAANIAQTKARLTGRPDILSPGKVNELFHANWVAAPSPLSEQATIRFHEGFATTLAWYRAHGLLPAAAGQATSHSNRHPGDPST